mmetsp:Transcript_6306/g.8211  ORF Transcript_6306/g.8211 Transcript_6306/m.8211 type:complete len:181 (-) Transcript_6306:70-612(-)
MMNSIFSRTLASPRRLFQSSFWQQHQQRLFTTSLNIGSGTMSMSIKSCRWTRTKNFSHYGEFSTLPFARYYSHMASTALGKMRTSSLNIFSLSTRSSALQASMPSSIQHQQIRCKNTLRSNKACKKRFLVRGDGSLKRYKAGHAHNTGKKTKARKNNLGRSGTFKVKKEHDKIKRCLGVF